MSAQVVRGHRHHQNVMGLTHGLRNRRRGRLTPREGRATSERPGHIVYLECLDLDLLQEVARRLGSWAGARGWKVTGSLVTLHPENCLPSATRFPFHDPLAWPVMGREGEWIEAHRRDVSYFGEPPAGTLHLQCSGWLRTLACLKARGLAPQANILESVGAELPCPDHTFVLVGPFSEIHGFACGTHDSDQEWSLLGRAFEQKVADELESSAVALLGARVVEGNQGWSSAHYSLQIESVLDRAWKKFFD